MLHSGIVCCVDAVCCVQYVCVHVVFVSVHFRVYIFANIHTYSKYNTYVYLYMLHRCSSSSFAQGTVVFCVISAECEVFVCLMSLVDTECSLRLWYMYKDSVLYVQVGRTICTSRLYPTYVQVGCTICTSGLYYNLHSKYLKGHTKSVLLIRGTYYQFYST